MKSGLKLAVGFSLLSLYKTVKIDFIVRKPQRPAWFKNTSTAAPPVSYPSPHPHATRLFNSQFGRVFESIRHHRWHVWLYFILKSLLIKHLCLFGVSPWKVHPSWPHGTTTVRALRETTCSCDSHTRPSRHAHSWLRWSVRGAVWNFLSAQDAVPGTYFPLITRKKWWKAFLSWTRSDAVADFLTAKRKITPSRTLCSPNSLNFWFSVTAISTFVPFNSGGIYWCVFIQWLDKLKSWPDVCCKWCERVSSIHPTDSYFSLDLNLD